MIPAIYSKLKSIITQLSQTFKLFDETPKSGRPRKINNLDALTLALYKQASTRATKKSVYEDFKNVLCCSYKTLVVWMNRIATVSLRFLHLIMRLGIKHQQLRILTEFLTERASLTEGREAARTLELPRQEDVERSLELD